MRRAALLTALGTLTFFGVSRGELYAINYDMACVEKYSSASGFNSNDDVSLTCDATDGFDLCFRLFGGHNRRFYWHDTLVWPRDYTEDSFAGGGDNVEADWLSADLAVFSGHGSCQSPPIRPAAPRRSSQTVPGAPSAT